MYKLVTLISNALIVLTLLCDLFVKDTHNARASIALITYAIVIAIEPQILVSKDKKVCLFFVVCAFAGVVFCLLK